MIASGVGLALSGGLPLHASDGLAVMQHAADAGLGPVLATEVSGLSATDLCSVFAASRPTVTTGTGIVPLGSRSLPAIAMAARTAAQFSDRRFLLGVGVSTPQIVGGWHGQEHDASMATTRDRLTGLRALLQGERRGSFAMPADAGDGVAVLLGALGPRMIRLGLEVADGIILNHTPADRVPEDVPDGAVVLAYMWVYACADAEVRGRRELVSYAMAAPYAAHFTRMGFGEAMEEVAALHGERRLSEAPARLPDELIDAIYVAPERLEARVEAYHRAGAVPIVLPVTGEDPVAEMQALLSRPELLDLVGD